VGAVPYDCIITKHITVAAIGVCLFAAAPITGCASGSGAAATVKSLMPTITQLMGEWNVESRAAKSVAEMLPKDAKVPSLTFAKDGGKRLSLSDGTSELVRLLKAK